VQQQRDDGNASTEHATPAAADHSAQQAQKCLTRIIREKCAATNFLSKPKHGSDESRIFLCCVTDFKAVVRAKGRF
jgi:hypothetical protein